MSVASLFLFTCNYVGRGEAKRPSRLELSIADERAADPHSSNDISIRIYVLARKQTGIRTHIHTRARTPKKPRDERERCHLEHTRTLHNDNADVSFDGLDF